MFGLEIRKLNKVNLFADVDKVLSSDYNVEKEAIIHSLQKMMKSDSHFSICTIDQCSKIHNIDIPEKTYNILHAIHCVRWREMTEEFRQYVVAIILNIFKPVLCDEFQNHSNDQ